MADPLLSSLCGICHVKEPKYKCPRCGAKTCSLSCVKKHKSWSSCNGERDSTVYVPPSKLRTDAGIDHDYNFLTKIERTVERTEKMFVEEKGIRLQGQLYPSKRHEKSKGQSRGKASVESGKPMWERLARQRLASLNINVTHVPLGMARANENSTNWNKVAGLINWQVEFLCLESELSADGSRCSTRLLHRTPETTPLYVAFAECLEAIRRSQLSHAEREQERIQAKERRANAQDVMFCAWGAAASVMQNPATRAWSSSRSVDITRREARLEKQRTASRFYVQIPGTPSREPRKIVPVDATETLGNALRGLEVLEFPTLVVMPAECELPAGFTISPRGGQQLGEKSNPHNSVAKKRKRTVNASDDEEDGEIREGERANVGQPQSHDDVGDDEVYNARTEGGTLGIDDDTTSISGSDSEMPLN